ncbi:MAG: type III-B CRISPR module RAMP protein Cmr1 [bacterium]|nr:type III-B CRISPR module RAMP protein Cmr1 [bacterium]
MQLSLSCKVVTPMFMSGADGRTPEIRPSEFKGMMRWWWRAIKAEDDIDNLRNEENQIFGGTSKGGKSKVWIRIKKENNIQIGNNLKNDEKLDWSFDQRIGTLKGKHAGIGYLLYSTVLPNRERSYIKTNSGFSIDLISVDEKAFKVGLASLWLAIYLGGFGTRARRGGGNIEVLDVKCEQNNTINFICQAKNRNDLKKFLEDNINAIKSICRPENGTKKYTNLIGAKILIFEPRGNWKEALNFLGEEYKEFRVNNKNSIFKTASFGMPVMHSRFTVRMVPYTKQRTLLSDRWASPIIFKVIKSNNLYFPVIVRLKSGGVEFVGKEEKKDNRWLSSQAQKIDESLIDQFWNSLLGKGEELNI